MTRGRIGLILIPKSMVCRKHAQSHKNKETDKYVIKLYVFPQSNSHLRVQQQRVIRVIRDKI